MKNLNIKKHYSVGYDGNDKMKQIIDFALASLVAATMVSMVLLIIISHIVGGE